MRVPKMSSNRLTAEREPGAAGNHKLTVNQQWDAAARKADLEQPAEECNGNNSVSRLSCKALLEMQHPVSASQLLI